MSLRQVFLHNEKSAHLGCSKVGVFFCRKLWISPKGFLHLFRTFHYDIQDKSVAFPSYSNAFLFRNRKNDGFGFLRHQRPRILAFVYQI